MSAKGNTDSAPQNYFGSILGLVCAGPVDELVSVVIDGKTVWPTDKGWADDIVELTPISYKRTSNVARIEFATPHRIGKGKPFILTSMVDGSFNASTVATETSAYALKYASVGANVALTTTDVGKLTKVVTYATDDLIRYAGSIWKCKAPGHTLTLAKAPPNPTYWDSYSVLRTMSSNPYTFTIADSNVTYGQAHFYWGTSTQTLRAGTFLAGHPPYRHFACLELERFLFGPEREGPPNIQVVTRRAAKQTLITSPLISGQCNPIATLADLALDPIFGAGLPAILDATTAQAVADALAVNDDKFFLSPKLDTRIPFREFISKLLAYYDGWLRWNALAKIEFGKFAHEEAPPSFTPETTLDFNDATEKIRYTPQTWADTFDSTTCKFVDQVRAYKDASRKYRSGFNRAVLNEPRNFLANREWINREAQAIAYATEWEKIYAQRKISGVGTWREEKAIDILPGELFLAVHDVVELSIICRCTEKVINDPSKGTVAITFESERGFAPVPFVPTVPNPTGIQLAQPETISLYQFVQPPPSLSGSTDVFQLLLLAARKHTLTRGFKTWFLVDDVNNEFYQLGLQKEWACFGTLAQNYAATAPALGTEPPDDASETLHVNFDDMQCQEDIDAIMDVQSEDAINDNSLLVWIFSAADPTLFEICTLREIRLDSGVYKLKVRRARYGTAQLAWSTNDLCWIGFRKDLAFYQHEKFEDYGIAGTPATFRLQAYTPQEEADLTDTDLCPDILFTFADPYAPTAAWVLQKVNGADIVSFATVYEPTDVFKMGFDLFSPAGALTDVNLIAKINGTERNVFFQNFDKQTYAYGEASFVLPQDGTWNLCLIVRDSTGRAARQFLYLIGGGGGFETITIETGGAGASATTLTPYALPSRNPRTSVFPSTIYFNVTLHCATAGATIYYQIEPLHVGDVAVQPSQVLPGAWIAYSGAFQIASTVHTIKRVWYFATSAGNANSATGFINY